MLRTVEPAWLDDLPADNPRAQRSRIDFQRINAVMRNSALVARELRRAFPQRPPKLIAEIGAGDGHFMLEVAHRSSQWATLQLLLIDRINLFDDGTSAKFRQSGWRAEAVTIDVDAWLAQATPTVADVIVANFFLHRLDTRELSALLLKISQRTRVLIACEPRRSRIALAGSRLLRYARCNEVTQHDAITSVRAGFAGRELSELWPDPALWTLREDRYGLFSHYFVAVKTP
jgi:phospholipid N-methyltransferase